MASRSISAGLLFALTSGFIGCGGGPPPGPTRAAVEGTVSLDGEPLSEGVIRFRPTDGNEGPLSVAAIEFGRFSFAADVGPIIGSHSVEIESTDTGGFAMDDEAALEDLNAMAKPPQIKVVRVPAKYSKSSPLSADVTEAGPNLFNFDLLTEAK